jgi:hypothetical protein
MIEPTIRTKLDQHFIAAQTHLYRSIAGGSFEVTPDWVRGFSGLQIPAFNVFMPLTDEGLTDETLADTAAFFPHGYITQLVSPIVFAADYLNERRYHLAASAGWFWLAPNVTHLNSAVVIERVNTVPTLTALFFFVGFISQIWPGYTQRPT